MLLKNPGRKILLNFNNAFTLTINFNTEHRRHPEALKERFCADRAFERLAGIHELSLLRVFSLSRLLRRPREHAFLHQGRNRHQLVGMRLAAVVILPVLNLAQDRMNA